MRFNLLTIIENSRCHGVATIHPGAQDPGRNRWKSPGNPNRFVAEIMGGLGRYFWSKMTVPPGNITQNPTNFIQLVSIPLLDLLDKMTTTGFKHLSTASCTCFSRMDTATSPYFLVNLPLFSCLIEVWLGLKICYL